MASNDNSYLSQDETAVSADAHGQAALLLTESLIHGLRQNSTLGPAEAVEIAERAVDVQFDRAEAADGAGASMWQSHALLSSIAASLRTDCGDAPAPPHLVL